MKTTGVNNSQKAVPLGYGIVLKFDKVLNLTNFYYCEKTLYNRKVLFQKKVQNSFGFEKYLPLENDEERCEIVQIEKRGRKNKE